MRFVRFVTPTCLNYGSDDASPNLEAVEALLAACREELGPDGRIFFGTFPSEIAGCNPTELSVYRRHQAALRVRGTLSPGRHVFRVRSTHFKRWLNSAERFAPGRRLSE